MPSEPLDLVRALWCEREAEEIHLVACPVSGNNRVFVASSGDERVVAKQYFSNRNEAMDRMEAEWSFLSHVRGRGVDAVPLPIARDVKNRIALYEFVEGRRLHAEEIGAHHVSAAAHFISAINTPDGRAQAAALPCARESGFSLEEHMAGLERRLSRLDGIAVVSDADREAVCLVGMIRAYWLSIRDRMRAEHAALGRAPDASIDEEERLISPSDFGFHNTLLRPDGRLAFIDFEYAGWDDVAKLAADYFYQPEIPVSRAAFAEDFLAPILAGMNRPEWVRQRIDILRPLFGLRWCCIMLNFFLPEMIQRIKFADPAGRLSDRKKMQLQKAHAAFFELREETCPI